MALPETKNWSAVSKVDDLAGSDPHLTLGGDVSVSSTNKRAVLKRKSPQGTSSAILIVNLTIESTGNAGNTGNEVMPWQHVSLTEPLKSGQHYASVSVLFDGEELTSINVQDIKSLK